MFTINRVRVFCYIYMKYARIRPKIVDVMVLNIKHKTQCVSRSMEAGDKAPKYHIFSINMHIPAFVPKLQHILC